MTDAPQDDLDFSALGTMPLPGELDDEALLANVLDAAAGDPGEIVALPPAQSTASAWVRPAVVALTLLAAAVVLAWALPSSVWTFETATDVESLAPDVHDDVDDDVVVPTPPPRATPQVEPPREVEASPEPAPEPEPDPAPRTKARVSPENQLRAAQDAFAAGDRRAALARYRQLVRQHPRSEQAHVAKVSIGRLELKAGHPKAALRSFDAYLDAKGGSMRREAAVGRIEALRALGRPNDERAAIEAFLRSHGDSAYAGRLERRLESLQ
ncbi:MAG: hypothetical protein AAGA54_28910 [Myxococcota bacterium]